MGGTGGGVGADQTGQFAVQLLEVAVSLGAAVLVVAVGACAMLCVLLRHARQTHAVLMRRGSGGAPNPLFNRIETEMQEPAKPEGVETEI